MLWSAVRRWSRSPTNIVTGKPDLAGVFAAADNESEAALRRAMERFHDPLELVPWQSKRMDSLTRKAEDTTFMD